ncbi:MAG: hypothetical protein JXR73_18400 [Candidatus Omnitrophica bacterium]|nr:hypothetical protein [Candidatus Omnitrophota bacterium]
MTQKAFLIIKADDTAWVLTFDPETRKRFLYDFHSWLLEKDPAPAVSPAESWLEHEGAVIEAAFPIDAEKRTIAVSPSDMLEHAELLEDIELY